MKNFRLIVPTLFLLFFSIGSYATIIYDADASSSFTLLDAGGLTISATTGPEAPTSMTSGSGTASIDADVLSDPALFPGSSLTLESDVSGSAGASPGTSSTTVMNSFLITLANTTMTDLTAIFEFTYDWDISLTQGPASAATLESGFASSFFHLSGFFPSGEETLAIDDGLGGGPMSVTDWLFNPSIAFDFADLVTPASMTGSTTVTAYVTVPAMSTDMFSVITDAAGGAVRVAEPQALSLIFTLSLFLLVRRNFNNS